MPIPAPPLPRPQANLLSQILQDIRTTYSHIAISPTPLSALDSLAIDAFKDLYYMLNTEDPLSALPLRRYILQTDVPAALLFPIIQKLHNPTSNQKRWSVPMYQLLRLCSVLTSGVGEDNATLHRGCALDEQGVSLRSQLAHSQASLSSFTHLLQYYLERKAIKADALASAEDSKLEDARIDNILRFFRNILSPPRRRMPTQITASDRGVHLAIIASLAAVDFYATLNLIFATKLDAHSQNTDLVFLVADIYALTYRHSSPREMYVAYRNQKKTAAPSSKRTSAAKLRAALQRERATIGGQAAVATSARWMTRHSGGFTIQKTSSTQSTKRIISARAAVQSRKSLNPQLPLQTCLSINSQILCLQASRIRSKAGVRQKKGVSDMRHDLQHQGISALVSLTKQIIEISFSFFLTELRERIDETKQRMQAAENDVLKRAQRAFLRIVGAVVGFQRERYGKVQAPSSDNPKAIAGSLHENCMKSILSADLKIVNNEWKAVEAAIELDTFKLVFLVLVEACEGLRESGKDENKVETVEIATFAALEMMKMLQGMAACQPESDPLVDPDTKQLLPREVALNTLEQLFESQSFLNAPAELAKDFSIRLFSFTHLTNIVELAHAFTTILLDEKELARLQVKRIKRKRTRKTVHESDDEEKDGVAAVEKKLEDGPKINDESQGADKLESVPMDESEPIAVISQEDVEPIETQKRTNHIVESEDEDEDNPAPIVHSNSEETAIPNNPMGSDTVKDIPGSDATDESFEKRNPTTVGTEILQGADEDVLEKISDAKSDVTVSTEKQAAKSAPLSTVQQMLLADQANGPSQKPELMVSKKKLSIDADNGGKQGETPLSKEQHVHSADANNSPTHTDGDKVAIVQSMLLADKEDEGNEKKELPPLVSTIQDLRREKAAKGEVAQNPQETEGGNISDGYETDEGLGLKEIESVGIVRRFAHVRALQNLVLPIRAALCQLSALSGTAHPTPEDSNALQSSIVVAKSAHVLSAVWRVAKIRERGMLCGQFYSYGNMHLMSVIMHAAKQSSVRKNSVLDRLSACAQDVSKGFFSWLAINPGLSLDLFFPMDKGSCHMYTTCMRNLGIQEAERIAQADNSGNDSDTSLRDIEKFVNIDSQSPRVGSQRRSKKRKNRERRRADRSQIEEDEDVDDLDNLNIGIDNESDGQESNPRPKKKRASRRKDSRTKRTPPPEKVFSSSDEMESLSSDLDNLQAKLTKEFEEDQQSQANSNAKDTDTMSTGAADYSDDKEDDATRPAEVLKSLVDPNGSAQQKSSGMTKQPIRHRRIIIDDDDSE